LIWLDFPGFIGMFYDSGVLENDEFAINSHLSTINHHLVHLDLV